MIRGLAMAGALALGIGLGGSAWAQEHTHAGDIAVSESGGALQVGGTHFEIHGTTGYKIFEANFGDLAGGPWSTDDPGFQTQNGGWVTPSSLIGFQGSGSLSFWNGVTWSAAASGVAVSLADALDGALTTWTGSGVTHGEYTYVGQAGDDGTLHEHLDMYVTSGAPVGAYLIQMSLTSDQAGVAASPPFYIAFNRGLSADAFEASVGALVAAPVPEPETYAMLVAGLVAIGAVVRKRRQPSAG